MSSLQPGQERRDIQGHGIERQGNINSDMQRLQGIFHMIGLCLKCFSSGVDVITNEKNPEAACEKCKDK